MSQVRRGTVTAAPSWSRHWKHFRPYFKRMYWKAERRAWKHVIARETP